MRLSIPPLLAACMGGLVALAHLAGAQPQQPGAVRVGFLLGEGSQPFTYLGADGQPAGFEIELMKWLCTTANLTCNFMPIDTLEDRFTAVVNGSVDVAIGQIGFTPNRSTAVDYVQPFYYSIGTVLLTPRRPHGGSLVTGPLPRETSSPSTATWDTLAGQKICFLRGYYATPFILQRYDVKAVTVDSVAEGVAKTQDGPCEYFAYPSGTPQAVVGLPVLPNVQPIYETPYGLIVAKGNHQLKDLFTVALVAAMGAGNESALLQLEQKELIAKGVVPNGALQTVVNAISTFASGGEGEEALSMRYSIFGAPIAG